MPSPTPRALSVRITLRVRGAAAKRSQHIDGQPRPLDAFVREDGAPIPDSRRSFEHERANCLPLERMGDVLSRKPVPATSAKRSCLDAQFGYKRLPGASLLAL